MNRTVLFPFDLNSFNPPAYYYALELSRKINHNLKVVSAYRKSETHYPFLKKTQADKSERIKKQFHLQLLELNGVYHGKYNQWQTEKNTKINAQLHEGEMVNVLLTLLKNKASQIVLCDYQTFTKDLLPADFLCKSLSVEYKLWIIPQGIEQFNPKPELSKPFFDFDKKEMFGDLLWQTKFYSLPNDYQQITQEYKAFLAS